MLYATKGRNTNYLEINNNSINILIITTNTNYLNNNNFLIIKRMWSIRKEYEIEVYLLRYLDLAV